MDYYIAAKNAIKALLIPFDKKAYGTEIISEGKGIIAANHEDWKDILVMEALIPKRLNWLATKEPLEHDRAKRVKFYAEYFQNGYSDNPRAALMPKWLSQVAAENVSDIVYWLLTNTANVIPIDKHGNGNNKEAMQKVVQLMDEDKLLCWFPGTQITEDGSISPFLHGLSSFLHIYAANGRNAVNHNPKNNTGYANGNSESANRIVDVPVYPVAIKNSRKLFQLFNTSYLAVGAPMYLAEDLTSSKNRKDAIHSFTQSLENKVREMHANL